MSDVLLQFDGPIARLTINRPQVLNALNDDTCEQLLLAAKKIERNDKVRCIIFSGNGKSFSSGGDVNMLAERLADPERDLKHEFESSAVRGGAEFCQVMERIPAPVITSVRGAVSGGGLGLALSGDFIIASETAFFLAAHVRIGLSPDAGASWYLHRRIGARLAKEFLMLGNRIAAAEAERVGLVNRVVPDSDLETETDALAERLLALPAHAIASVKQLINMAPQHSFSDHLQMEAKLLGEAAITADFREGVEAFREKRPAQFNKNS